MSRAEDDYIAGVMAAEDRARRLRDEAAAKAAADAEAARRATLPRIALDEEQAQRIAATLGDAEILARQIVADYLKLSATHKKRLVDLGAAVREAMRLIVSAPILTPPTAAPPDRPPPARRASAKKHAKAKARGRARGRP